MQRRSFLSKTALAGASLGLSVTGLTANAHPYVPFETNAFPLEETTIKALQEQLTAGKMTSEKLVISYLSRIAEIDKKGPALNAVIEINPDAVSIATILDKERKAGKSRGPLHGIPVLIKDNIDTADKMQTTAGSLALAGNIASKDAYLVELLRSAGAVILGKTNLSEWANFRSTKSCSGWSSRGGQTKNPYIIDHNPCGSSSGSGVAVSANLCVVAVGTETDGSIVCPAAVNGAVGIKPTVGLVSRSGIIPISSTQDTAGPIARTVEDAALLLSVLSKTDINDTAAAKNPAAMITDYSKFIKPGTLKGKRIGIEKTPQGDNHYCHTVVATALAAMKKAGATIIEISYLDELNKLGEAEFDVLQFEFKDGVNKYLSRANAKVKSLAEVIAFNRANEDKAMPYFKQETLVSAEAKKGLDSKPYLEALEKSHEGSKTIIDKVMLDNNLDAICGLTMGPACSIDMIYGDRWGDIFLTMPAAVSGYPHITVPAGKVYNLPVGLSFFGKAYTEGLLIEIAYGFEQATKHRTKPEFKKSFI